MKLRWLCAGVNSNSYLQTHVLSINYTWVILHVFDKEMPKRGEGLKFEIGKTLKLKNQTYKRVWVSPTHFRSPWSSTNDQIFQFHMGKGLVIQHSKQFKAENPPPLETTRQILKPQRPHYTFLPFFVTETLQKHIQFTSLFLGHSS